MKILAVDCNYVEKEFAASFLLVQNTKGLFIECNTTHAIPFLVEAAAKEGLAPEQIEALIITHVHLDHAGGAGAFLNAFPNAKVYAHPRAARHLIDPSKLISSATAVYGEARMQEWYGTIYPCDPARVVVVEDGETIPYQGELLQTKHLRGHANHHLVVMEPKTRTLFTGDTFGVAYPELTQKGDFILASTSPTDFDGDAALSALEWILLQKPKQIALTHFGFVPEEKIHEDALILRDELHFSIDLVKEAKEKKLSVEVIQKRLSIFLSEYFEKRGLKLDSEDRRLLEVDIKVNAQGLHYAANKPS